MRYLLEHTDAKDRAVRFRSSQLIASVIAALPEDAELECASLHSTECVTFLTESNL